MSASACWCLAENYSTYKRPVFQWFYAGIPFLVLKIQPERLEIPDAVLDAR